MSLEDVPRCQHVKVNGTQCGSPALRRRRHCYFHDHMLDGKRRFANRQEVKPRAIYSMCLLEDANAVQLAVMQVLQLLGSGQMDTKTAGLMLYGLQIASSNLRHTTFEAAKPTDVVIDRNTLDQTCLNGPQWFARDFAAGEKAAQENEEESGEESGHDTMVASAETTASEAAPSQPAPADVCRTKVRAAKPHKDKRKRPQHIPMEDDTEESETPVQDFYYKVFGHDRRPEAAAEAG
jgi:hypothetical protein